MKVGEISRRTGVSIRTLHYYDEIGLLPPSTLTTSRHRVYGAEELARLQQIKSLRQLGFSLDEVRECLDTPALSPRRVLELHVARIREQIDQQQRLAALLETLAVSFDRGTMASVDDLIAAIESITSMERTFTVEELADLKKRGAALGPERIRAAEQEWPRLIANVRAEMERGSDPASDRVRPLARRWRELVREFSGGNREIERKVHHAYVSEPWRMKTAGLDPQIFAYVNQAIRALPE